MGLLDTKRKSYGESSNTIKLDLGKFKFTLIMSSPISERIRAKKGQVQ